MSTLPPQPQRPPPPEPESRARGSSCLPIALAVLLGVVACVVLFFLTLNTFGPVLVIAALVFAFAALHYLVWGWWLPRMIRQDVEEEERGEGPGPSGQGPGPSGQGPGPEQR